ncbi:unnamed protein product [Periconia digitata]|uniref:Uncharacterized protein n=1 Tax=Periconia digitata TaxID=1303443 RepID=A0A9W4ULT1_9PLEO|nr:unnamed protein product [Periconia digitata]
MGSIGRSIKASATPGHPSQSTSSANPNFLSLPEKIRKEIFRRVLSILHPLFIFQDPGCPVEMFAPDRPPHWLAITYVNREISCEASSVLYEINHFHLLDMTQQQSNILQSFFNCIGARNVAFLSHLDISFPVGEAMDSQPGTFRFGSDSFQSLKLLQRHCNNLSTLEVFIHNKNIGFFENPEGVIHEALSVIAAEFRAISSLQNVVVRVIPHEGIPAPAKDLMRKFGWAIVFGDKDP